MAKETIAQLKARSLVIRNETVEGGNTRQRHDDMNVAIIDSMAHLDSFVNKETPTGAINGINVTFNLANTPIVGSEHIYLNGLLLESGGGNDYTIAAAVITMLAAPESGDRLRVSYRK